MKSTTYQHRTDIDEAAGSIFCDCSGLLGHALRTDFPEAYLAVLGDEAPWRARPLAVTFFETFERSDGNAPDLWRQIPRLIDARPGDILAWRKVNIVRGKTTGHVCLIDSLPVAELNGQIRVRVIDSTRAIHEDDTRKDGETGVGAGLMWFEVDTAGRPIAFTIRKDSRRIDSNRILIGRLQNIDSPETVTSSSDRDLIGLEEGDAQHLAKQGGLEWRIIERDGTVIPMSLSRRNPQRLNVVTKDGKVVRIRRG